MRLNLGHGRFVILRYELLQGASWSISAWLHSRIWGGSVDVEDSSGLSDACRRCCSRVVHRGDSIALAIRSSAPTRAGSHALAGLCHTCGLRAREVVSCAMLISRFVAFAQLSISLVLEASYAVASNDSTMCVQCAFAFHLNYMVE